MGGNGGFPILANETQRLYGGPDETADLLGLFSNQAITGRQCPPGVPYLVSEKKSSFIPASTPT